MEQNDGSDEAKAPLAGVRIVSMTTGVAGPRAARLLAQSGADVIKIESRNAGLDGFRYFRPADEEESEEAHYDLDKSVRFAEANFNVRSVTLNLKEKTGRRLAQELVSRSDVMLDNFRPGVLSRLGLGPDQLRALYPELIIAKMPGMGCTGPRSGFGTWGPTLAAFSGLTYLWNHPGPDVPVGSQSVYPDYVASVLAPTVIAAALLRRRKTGEGMVLDMAQSEGVTYLLGVNYMEASLSGDEPEPMGNALPSAVVSDVFPCVGEERWCAVTVETVAQWRGVCDVIGHPELGVDAEYA